MAWRIHLNASASGYWKPVPVGYHLCKPMAKNEFARVFWRQWWLKTDHDTVSFSMLLDILCK